MTYRILLSHQAESFYKRLDEEIKKRVKGALIALDSSPPRVLSKIMA